MNRCQNIGNAMCCCSACCRPFVFRRDFGCWQKTALLPLIEVLFSLQLAFNGFNPGPNGLGGITLTGWPSSINERVDKNGNITYTFNVMGAALFAQVTVRLGYGSNYSTVTVSSNTNGRELTFSGNLVPYSQSNIFQSGFSF